MSFAWLLAVVVVREIAGRAGDLLQDPAKRRSRRKQRRLTHVDRLVSVLAHLKGVFVKAGQFASMRHDVLAPDVRARFASLQDQVPPLAFPLIVQAIENELGRPLSEAFAFVSPEPLGAASIAQVHRATLVDGREVAIKVQYPWLADSLKRDLRLLERGVALACWWSGRQHLDPAQLVQEFGTGMARELDFELEAATAAEIAANLADDPQIEVPSVIPSHSTRRILCMDYSNVVGIADREGLARLGVAPRTVLEILARAYGRQIFVDGLFHADPHPGNLFVIDEPGAAENPRVLFVDFGLSQRLDLGLRRHLRQAIFAILQRNRNVLGDQMSALGMFSPEARTDVEGAIQTMFDQLEATSGAAGPLAASGGQILGLKGHAVKLLEETPGLQLPHELLLYAKTLSYLFGLAELLDPDVDMMKLCLPYLLQFLATRD